MELIANKKELLRNIKQLDDYVTCKEGPENGFSIDLVKKGICFVAVQSGESYKFYPSRFIAYRDNTMTKYLANELKDAQETMPTISHLIGCKPSSSLQMDKAYKKYCEGLGFTARNKGAFGIERKYWILQDEADPSN